MVCIDPKPKFGFNDISYRGLKGWRFAFRSVHIVLHICTSRSTQTQSMFLTTVYTEDHMFINLTNSWKLIIIKGIPLFMPEFWDFMRNVRVVDMLVKYNHYFLKVWFTSIQWFIRYIAYRKKWWHLKAKCWKHSSLDQLILGLCSRDDCEVQSHKMFVSRDVTFMNDLNPLNGS